MTAYGLTDRESEFLAFITDHAAAGNKMPSFDEFREHFGLKSKSGVHRIITSLERKGHISRIPGHARAIRISGISTKDALNHVLANCDLPFQVKAHLHHILRHL